MNYLILTIVLIGINLASANYLQLFHSTLLKVNTVPIKYGTGSKNLEIKYHTQRINHFDENDTRTFIQRYLEDREFHKPDGPIILFVGAQEGLLQEFIQSGPVRELAEINNGYLLYPEHRYIGQSLPFLNASLENLQYMKVDQVLADIAHLINAVKTNETRFKNSKVILVGVSLSGTLASWFRVKYPELSAGAWASSGPVEAQADVPEHKVEVGSVFETFGGKKCYNKIRDGFKEIEKDLEKGNMTKILKHLRICDEFDPLNDKDHKMLIHTLGSLFSALVASTNQKYIESTCASMNDTNDNIEAIAAALKDYISEFGCLSISYKNTIEAIQNEFDRSNYRAYFYLACYEYGWWTSCEAENQPFGTIVKFDYFVDMCRDVFRDERITKEFFHQNAKRLNEEYGGLKGNFTNLYTTQGLLDPNRIQGLTTNVSPTAFTEVIYGASHANDIYYFFFEETGPIKKARLEAKLLISKWLQE